MKNIMKIGCEKVAGVVMEMPDNIGLAVKEEFNNLKDVLDGDCSPIEKLYTGVSFLDPQAWAEKHPEAVKPVTVTVLGAVGMACPVTIPIATVVGLLPQDVCTTLMDWGNRPCPPYLLRKFLKSKMKNTPEADNVIVIDPEIEFENDNTDIAEAV